MNHSQQGKARVRDRCAGLPPAADVRCMATDSYVKTSGHITVRYKNRKATIRHEFLVPPLC